MPEYFHSYFVCPRNRREAVAWNPFDPQLDVDLDANLEYFGRILQEIERELTGRSYTFYLVWEHLDWLPSYGDDVVVLLLGDERHRVPAYAGRVAAVYKCFGTRPKLLGSRPWHRPRRLHVSIAAEYLRNWLVCLPGWLRYQAELHRRGSTAKPVWDLPLGYYKQVESPVADVADRPDDVFFAGSVANQDYRWWSPTRWLAPPKEIARGAMLRQLTALQARRPELRCSLGTIGEFDEARRADGRYYAERLMAAKICLVPRGTTAETYRFSRRCGPGVCWWPNGCPTPGSTGAARRSRSTIGRTSRRCSTRCWPTRRRCEACSADPVSGGTGCVRNERSAAGSPPTCGADREQPRRRRRGRGRGTLVQLRGQRPSSTVMARWSLPGSAKRSASPEHSVGLWKRWSMRSSRARHLRLALAKVGAAQPERMAST